MRQMRLVLCSAAFLGWLGYLGFLVLTRPQRADGAPLVVSRPQVLASQLDVIALLPEPTEGEVKVKVEKVLYPAALNDLAGDEIRVTNLADCRPLSRAPDVRPDWSGPGSYLLLLRKVPNRPGAYEVSPIPPSPGFTIPGVVRIYPAESGEAEAQYRLVEKP